MQISLNIPLQDTQLFGSQAAHDLLTFLSRHHDERFSISELTDVLEYTRKSVSNAVDTLENNELILTERRAQTRAVMINSNRLTVPGNPYFQLPQAEFRRPTRVGIDRLLEELTNVLGIIVYGSVARGEADRRSDIDIWVLVKENRPANQRAANTVKQDLEAKTFEAGRYEYDIDVEVLEAIPKYEDQIRETLRDGVVIYETDQFQTVRSMIFRGKLKQDS